ncbi:NAD(P)-binding domain-containing protein [Sphingobium sufflavum]|uniref:pyrroline-5-carboxylate reductase family protein n=1 Tax=Sphingobium sufflavum TaxID=1129547 RepID=UPI001F2EB1FC|nr:pyrroline-5-carboxylate reductase dimerization domain-containing protein [Sphingobium sufflavum]MCE7798566.1 NAD(P)-binding domain-containing protein [Sphingobium sufflavum]
MARRDVTDNIGSLADWDRPLLLIGCGNMAGSILARWLDSGLSPERVQVVDPAQPALVPGIDVRTALPERIAPGTIVLVGIKPQQFDGISGPLNALLDGGAVVLSIMAGLPVGLLRKALPRAVGIVRLMPNLPVRTGEGVVLTFSEGAENAQVGQLLAPLGLVEALASEDDFDLGTALSGCGPAYVYRVIDALAAAASRLGLGEAQAARLALQTVAGAASAASRSDSAPAAMADAVASPGGMTRLGLDVLDADERLVELLTDTLRAARDRGAELAAASLNA